MRTRKQKPLRLPSNDLQLPQLKCLENEIRSKSSINKFLQELEDKGFIDVKSINQKNKRKKGNFYLGSKSVKINIYWRDV